MKAQIWAGLIINYPDWGQSVCIFSFVLAGTSCQSTFQEVSSPFCHFELNVSHICSYGYTSVWVLEWRKGEASVCSSLHTKKKLYETLVQHGRSCLIGTELKQLSETEEKKENKYIYRHIYIVQNIYRPFVPLNSCSGLAASSALYHVIIIHRLVLMTRGWYDCFFHVKCIFCNKCLCFWDKFHVCVCTFKDQQNTFMYLRTKQANYLSSPFGFGPVEVSTWESYPALVIIIFTLSVLIRSLWSVLSGAPGLVVFTECYCFIPTDMLVMDVCFHPCWHLLLSPLSSFILIALLAPPAEHWHGWGV